MIKILNIIGARPQIIKASAISRAIRNNHSSQIEDIIIHTGQHYDQNMSSIFFDELNIPKPFINLKAGSTSHGKQTAEIITGIEDIILKQKPDCIVVYGDTNSTLAASVAASKLHCPIVHIEAGLRSFNKSMPEEINRIVCDHVSTLLFAPTQTAIKNLQSEGFSLKNQTPYTNDNPAVFHCGDVMFDNSLYYSSIADENSDILKKLNIDSHYVLTTVHRDNNTDNPARLNNIFQSVIDIASNNNVKFVIPLHPRTQKVLESHLFPNVYKSISSNKNIIITPPVSFFDMIVLEKNASLIMTDSGGVQKEAFFFKKPCIILRTETEWKELVECGAAKITDANNLAIYNAYKHFQTAELQFPPIFGDGTAAEFICNAILKHISKR